MMLAEFLAARLDEDEAWARDTDLLAVAHPIHAIAGRVLREVEAVRHIMDLCAHSLSYEPPVPARKRGEWALASLVLEGLALPYADHPDYDEAWRP